MKRKTHHAVLILSFALCLAAGAGAAAAQTAGESFSAYIGAYKTFEDSLANTAPWDKIGEEHVIPMDPVAQIEHAFWPLAHLGRKNKQLDGDKKMYGVSSVKFSENGNEFRIECKADGASDTYEGSFDPPSGALHCRLVRKYDGGEIGEDEIFEYRRTDSGYTAQIYSFHYGAAHKLSLRGRDGAVGWDAEPGAYKAITAGDGADYPKSCFTWYETSGQVFRFKPSGGEPRELSKR
ncbi:MAG: hypothetical protein LBU26_05700 [Synergistaceae bacterium]|nr:hypothetical protein [Synergistaceae bacterium]